MVNFIVTTLTLSLLAGAHPFAQAKPRFSGKWMFDAEKTPKVNANSDKTPLCGGEGLVINQDEKELAVICTNPASRSVYSLVGAETTVPFGQTNGRAKATWEGDRLVVTITLVGESRRVLRTYYLDGPSLVIEQSSSADGATVRLFYSKS